MAIDLDHIIAADVARRDRQESRRLDIAQMRDKEEPVAIVHALGGAVESISILTARALKGYGLAVRLQALALDGDSAVHGRGRGLDVKRRALRKVIQPVEDLLML